MNASIISFAKSITQPRNKLTRVYLLDFLSAGQIDWLDESQAFIPYTAWFETGRKSIVDFPKKDITNFPDQTTAASFSSLQVGEEHCFFFRALDYYYHGAVITFRPAMWFLLRNHSYKLLLYRKRSMPLFRRVQHKRPKGFIYMINGRISFRKKKALDFRAFRRKYTKPKKKKIRFFLKKKKRHLRRRIKPLPLYLQSQAFQKKNRLCKYQIRKRLPNDRDKVYMEAIFQQSLYIRLRKSITRIKRKCWKKEGSNGLFYERKNPSQLRSSEKEKLKGIGFPESLKKRPLGENSSKGISNQNNRSKRK